MTRTWLCWLFHWRWWVCDVMVGPYIDDEGYAGIYIEEHHRCTRCGAEWKERM